MFSVLLLLASCQFPDARVCEVIEAGNGGSPVSAADQSRTKQHFNRTMFDGPSARWQFAYKKGDFLICGFVNGKNRFGAYVGWTPFLYDTKNGTGDIYTDENRLWLWDTLCLGGEYMDDRY